MKLLFEEGLAFCEENEPPIQWGLGGGINPDRGPATVIWFL